MSEEIWEKQDGESLKSFHCFQKYYLLQTVPRQLSKAYRQFLLEKGEKTPEKIRKSNPSRSWQLWSNAKDADGNGIVGLKTWAERADAYDKSQFIIKEQNYKEARDLLIQNEMEDYKSQLELWKLINHSFNVFVTTQRNAAKKKSENFNSSASIAKGRELAKWREDIAVFGRRTLKMPSTIKDFGDALADKEKPEIKWEEPLTKDDETGIGVEELNDLDDDER